MTALAFGSWLWTLSTSAVFLWSTRSAAASSDKNRTMLDFHAMYKPELTTSGQRWVGKLDAADKSAVQEELLRRLEPLEGTAQFLKLDPASERGAEAVALLRAARARLAQAPKLLRDAFAQADTTLRAVEESWVAGRLELCLVPVGALLVDADHAYTAFSVTVSGADGSSKTIV